jgi:DnaK suppressor protein
MTTSPAELEHFRQRLTAEAERLRALLTTLESGGEPGSEEVATLEDAAAEATVQEQYGAQTRDLANALRAVEAAQARLAAGAYGRCVDCGQPIPAARLEARPTAERCIRCEERRERTQRR